MQLDESDYFTLFLVFNSSLIRQILIERERERERADLTNHEILNFFYFMYISLPTFSTHVHIPAHFFYFMYISLPTFSTCSPLLQLAKTCSSNLCAQKQGEGALNSLTDASQHVSRRLPLVDIHFQIGKTVIRL